MSVAARKPVHVADPVEDFLPQTEFAREFWELRLQIEAKGGDFLDWEGVEREVAERRGERSDEP